MNIQAQLLPHKHIRFSESLIGLAGFVRQILKQPHTIDEIWNVLDCDNSGWFYRPTFEQLVIAVVILFALGQIKETTSHQLSVIHHETN
jgi:hypothetical protein